jgi:hypothetical protein
MIRVVKYVVCGCKFNFMEITVYIHELRWRSVTVFVWLAIETGCVFCLI